MPFIPSGTRAVIVTCLVFVSVALATTVAQQPPPTFRTGVEAVVMDVSVLDRDRRPVRGLTAADFTIFEDGKPQDVRTFKAIDIPDIAKPSAAWLAEVAPDVARNEVADGRVVVIFLDDISGMPVQEIPLARVLARRALEGLSADDLVAVVHAFNGPAGQPLTADRELVLASIDKFMGGIPDSWGTRPGNVDEDLKRLGTGPPPLLLHMLNRVAEISEGLSDFPQGRKAIVFVSVGLRIDIGAAMPALGGPTEAAADPSGVTSDLLRATWNAIKAAQRSNVSIYALDPGGLRTLAAPLNRHFLKGVSEMTGGFAVTDTNDPKPGIEQMVRENSSYYLLGYQPTNHRARGAFRKVEVRVSRPGVTVRSSNGYQEPQPEKNRNVASAVEKAEASLSGAVSTFAPKPDVAMRMTAVPFAIPGRGESAVAIVTAVTQPAPTGDRAMDNVKLRVTAYDLSGKQRASEYLNVDVMLRPTPTGGATFELLSRLDLKPGRYQIRTAAQSSRRERTGSVFHYIEVPDFSKPALSLSGVMLEVMPPVLSAPKGKLSALLPVLPTAQREFTAGEQVGAFLRVYQGGKGPLSPVVVTTRVVDGRDTDVFSKTETLGQDRFGPARAADYRVTLPVATLARGPHLVSITATRGTLAAKRDVRITLR